MTIIYLCITGFAIVLLCISMLFIVYLVTKIIEQSVGLILQWWEDRDRK